MIAITAPMVAMGPVAWCRSEVPMLGIWVASFGGALHGPVTTYFQVELGASTVARRRK